MIATDYESKEYADMKAQKMAMEKKPLMKINLTKEDLQALVEGKTVVFHDWDVQIAVKKYDDIKGGCR